LDLLVEPEALELAVCISRYPEAIRSAAETMEPSVLVAYLFELSHAISVAHNILWVKGQAKELAEARMLLYYAARITLGNGMKLVCLQPLERM
jgi:arginyl-tRNA synthetase